MDKPDIGKSPIDPDDWVKHFSSLFKPHNIYDTDKDIHMKIENMEKEECFNELSFQITQDEVKNPR